MSTLEGDWTYGYDGSGQLTRAVFTSLDTAVIPNQDLQYFYDEVGNRTKTIINGITENYAPNNLNQYEVIGAYPRTYDADGNLIYDGSSSFTYDQLNRLTAISGANGTRAFEYDFAGNREAHVENGLRTEYVIDHLSASLVVGEYGDTNQVIAKYSHGIGLASRHDANQGIAHLDGDAIGAIVSLTSANGTQLLKTSICTFWQ